MEFGPFDCVNSSNMITLFHDAAQLHGDKDLGMGLSNLPLDDVTIYAMSMIFSVVGARHLC